MRLLAGFLLGVAVVLVGATPAHSSGDNCLLILCVDAPVLGPVVGGIGDGLEDVLTPETPREEPPAPQVPNPAPQTPQQPAPGPQAPQQPVPNAPVTPQTPADEPAPVEVPSSPDSGNVSPPGDPGMTPQLTPDPVETPVTHDFDRDGRQDEQTFVLSPMLPFLLGGLAVLFAAISISAFASLFARRRRKELQDTRLVR